MAINISLIESNAIWWKALIVTTALCVCDWTFNKKLMATCPDCVYKLNASEAQVSRAGMSLTSRVYLAASVLLLKYYLK